MARHQPYEDEPIAQDMLRGFVAEIESCDDRIKSENEHKSEIYKTAKGKGFDVKVLRKVVAERRKDQEARAEQDAIFELYWNAVHGLAHAHVEFIEEFGSDDEPEHDADGVIIENTEPATSDPSGVAADAEGSDEPSLPSATKSLLVADLGEHPPSLAGVEGDEDRQPMQPETANEPDPAEVSGNGAGGENVDAAADSAGGRDSSPAVASNIIKIGSGKPLRPFCLHLDDLTKCGGYGKQHCGPCLKAHADAEGLTA